METGDRGSEPHTAKAPGAPRLASLDVLNCTVCGSSTVYSSQLEERQYEKKQRRQDDSGQKARRETQGWQGSGVEAQGRQINYENLAIPEKSRRTHGTSDLPVP